MKKMIVSILFFALIGGYGCSSHGSSDSATSPSSMDGMDMSASDSSDSMDGMDMSGSDSSMDNMTSSGMDMGGGMGGMGGGCMGGMSGM